MRPCRAATLLLLLALAEATMPALAEATTVPDPDGATTTSPASPESGTPGLWVVDSKALVSAAVELLNAKAVSPYVLQLWETQDRPRQPVDLQRRQELSFTVEETTCRAPGMVTTACKSRWLGALTRCQGWVFLDQQQPTVELSCEKMPTLAKGRRGSFSSQFPRIRTTKLRDFFTRVKERFKGFFQCSKIWIRDKLNLPKPQP